MRSSVLIGIVLQLTLTPRGLAGEVSRKPPAWLDTLTVDGFLDGGVVVNPSQPANGLNFGQYYTDRANWPQFNQGVLTIQRPLDPKATGLDYGFKFQGMLGTDVRYTEFLGQAEYLLNSRTQLTIVEAYAAAHLPILTTGGVDIKVGQFVTYNGIEVFPAKDNIVYTHSYSYNFGPFLHTGVITTTLVNDWLTVYAGITSGIDTFIGWPGDNNNSPSFHGGFSVSLLNGDLSIIGITHSGESQCKRPAPRRLA